MMLKVLQLVLVHHFNQRIIYIGEDFAKICNSGFWFKIWNFQD